MRNNLIKKKDTFKLTEKYWRIYTLVFLIFLASGVTAVRLYNLQVKAHAKYLAIAENQHWLFEELFPERGEIFLTDEKEPYPLAINQKLNLVYAVPKEIVDKEKTVSEIGKILDLDEEVLRKKIAKENDMYEFLKRRLSEQEIMSIKESKLPGIHLMPENFRFYPAGELASHVVGFLGSDGESMKGRYGIEAFWEETLRGESGSLLQEKDARGRWISIAEREIKPARNGSNLILTINHTVQYETERILKESVVKHEADAGTIIVVETNTGKILALANFPNFNPNEYGKTENMAHFLNPSVSLPYECGSVFKAITVAAGLDAERIEPDTEYVDSGRIKEAGFVIKNSEEKVYGRQTMTQVLEKSINTGAIFIQRQIGNERFVEYIKDFGFGEKTGVDLPGELSGNISNLKETKRNIHFFTASFGQGITVTPLQLVMAYAALGNDGRLMKPQIIEKIINGAEEKIIEPEEVRRVISSTAAEKTRIMLLNVVRNGHGKKAAVSGYLIGGKTGTAQVSKQGQKGYEEGITIGSFVGLAPVDNPRFAILVKIDNPKDVQWAESTAAPAFSRLAEFLLKYYDIKPTEG